MAVHKKFNALGRGLDALISTDAVRTQGSSTINEIAIDQIEANPNQPRREFDDEALHELAVSIREIGIIQPITLRQITENKFQIIAGERRWRASQLAGLKAIPAYIRTIKDENVMEMALVENIQREDLNAVEIALAYEHLLEGSGMTQEKVSERVGKSRTAITNYLRLLKLPAQVQMALQKKEIDMGHARALLAIDDEEQQYLLATKIFDEKLSVRDIEKLVKDLKKIKKNKKEEKDVHDFLYTELEESMKQILGSKVSIKNKKNNKGKIEIEYYSRDELERIVDMIRSI